MIPVILLGAKDATRGARPPLMLYNTRTKQRERFTPVRTDFVRMYNCGPLVLETVHLGNLRGYVYADILRRALLLNGYKVMQVVTLTDIDHTTSGMHDRREPPVSGEVPDTRVALGAIADRVSDAFIANLELLHVRRPGVLPRSSEHVAASIALIATLIQKEYAYRTSHGVYFDSQRFPGHGTQYALDTNHVRDRGAVHDHEKRNMHDFALWTCTKHGGWESPWGHGIPSLGTESAAMAMAYLGKEMDIRTGSVDDMNTYQYEITLSEAATGKSCAQFMLYHAPVLMEGVTFSATHNNTATLDNLIDHGYDPLAYRYWLLTKTYRTPMNFSITALDTAHTALKRLHRQFAEELGIVRTTHKDPRYSELFLLAINNDLDTLTALELTWAVVRDTALAKGVKRATLLYFDSVLSIGLTELAKNQVVLRALTVTSAGVSTDEPVNQYTLVPSPPHQPRLNE